MRLLRLLQVCRVPVSKLAGSLFGIRLLYWSTVRVCHAHISCCLTRDQMTRALLQSGLPLCWHTLHCSNQGDKDVPMPAERPAATTSSGLGKVSRLACVSSSQMGQERCGNCISMHFGIL